jgi:hypothetical protein
MIEVDVDLVRNAYHALHPGEGGVSVAAFGTNLLVIGVMFGAFISIGTWFFVRAERNRQRSDGRSRR